jgi:hypothetical protein
MTLTCPVCSAPDQACGHTELVKPIVGLSRGDLTMPTTNEGDIVLPRQPVRRGRGVPGYKGANITVVDPKTGKKVGTGATDAKATKAAADKD